MFGTILREDSSPLFLYWRDVAHDRIARRTLTTTVSYLAATAVLVAVLGQRVPHRFGLVVAHVTGAALLILLQRHAHTPPALRLLRDWHPLLFFPLLYKEVEPLAAALGNWQLTHAIPTLESTLFAGQPSLYLSARLSSVLLSEWLHFCYLAYIVMIPAVAVCWYTSRRSAFHELMWLLTTALLGSYVFFILFPVDSPYYLMPRPGAPIAGHFFFDLVHALSDRGGARGGAFPSAHVTGAVVLWLVAWRRHRALAIALAPIVMGLIVATVYGRFHYVLDAAAGIAAGSGIVMVFGGAGATAEPQEPSVPPVPVIRRVRRVRTRFRQARMLAGALGSAYQPVVAHLVVIRRCNLSCTYCNEFDDHSRPVPTADLLGRIDRLVALGTGIITLTGGEPLLHPDLDLIIRRIRQRGPIATLITNGLLLTRERIAGLNRAGLEHLQISIDNVVPDEVSKKSLKVLDQKLRWLAEHRRFDVTVNSVVGAGTRNPEDALTIARRARELGLSATVGLIHDGRGQLVPLDERQRTILETVASMGNSLFDYANYNRFQKNLAEGRPNDWRCRAGSRYLYVCEDGLVHWCSQQRGHPAIPLDRYSREDLQRQFHEEKRCAPHCTVGCVHRVAQVDELRSNALGALEEWFPASGQGAPSRPPFSVRLLKWAFVTGSSRELFRRAAVRVFGGGGIPRRSP